uniref:RHS repeat-associated core domain-containing protein n=1 Tax=Corynebacterium cystitidis TaxID=35757 RepID=UPI0027BA59C6
GRCGGRDEQSWSVPDAWLHDEVLGDIRPTVYRSTLSGDVWRIITPEGGVEDREYNDYHQITTRISAAGAVTRTDYNDDGLVVATVYPDGTTTYVEPGSWGVPVRVVGRDGHATEYDVDVFGMTTAITDPTGARSSFDYQIRASGAVVVASTSPEGLTTTIECDDAGRQLAVTDPAGRRTSFERDVRGLVTASMDPDGHTTTIDYTPEGWPTLVTNPDGTTVAATYDGEGNQLTLTNECGATTTTEYTVFDKPVTTTDATGAVTRLAYNTQMQPVALTNADGHTWSYEYDLDGMITRETDYNGIVTDTTLTPDGLISQVTTPAGMTTITRNVLGLTETIVDASGTTTYTYDELGCVTTITNPATTITYDRDEYGRVTAENLTLASGESTTTAIDLTPTGLVASQHVSLPSADTITTTFTRNSVGEVSSSQITHRVHGSEVPVTVADLTYSRGSRGQRDKITIGSLVRTFTYDTRGRMTTDHTTRLTTSTENTVGGGAGLEEIAGRDFTWRADSALIGIVDQLRGTTSFDVDPLGRVTSVTRDRSSTTTPSRPSPAGNLHDTHPGRTTTPPGSTGQETVVTESYGFSPAGVLSSIATPTISTSSGAVAPAATSVARVQTAATATADAQVDFQGTMPVRVGRTTYTYDKAGRVTQTVTRRISKKPLVKHFYYAASGQPIGFESSDQPGVGYRYVYDGLDRRVAKEKIDTASGRVLARVVFAHRGNQLVAQQATVGPDRGAGFVWPHDPASGEIIGQITLTGTHTHHPTTITTGDATPGDVRGWDQHQVDAEFFAIVSDLAGAPHEIIDPATGDVVGSSSQTLYGTRTWHGEQSSPLLFAGQYYDEESGWAYNRCRYYHPHAGVYNTQDPLGAAPRIASAQGYVNHPAHWVDVLGLKAHGVGKHLDPKAQHPDFPGRNVDGTFRGENGAAANGRRAHDSYSGFMQNQGYEVNRQLPGDTRLRPDAYAIDDNGFITEIRELKPDTASGHRRSGPQLNRYSEYAQQYNAGRAADTGLPAPTVRTFADWYTP